MGEHVSIWWIFYGGTCQTNIKRNQSTHKANHNWIEGLKEKGVSFGLTWTRLDSLELKCIHLHSLAFTWTHSKSLELTWAHVDSLGFTWTPELFWTHLTWFELPCTHLISLATWCLLDSLGHLKSLGLTSNQLDSLELCGITWPRLTSCEPTWPHWDSRGTAWAHSS